MTIHSSRKKQISTILILASILVMPGFLYYLLQEKGKNRYHPLAVFGPKQVAGTFHSVRGKQIPDTIYHQVKPFLLSNQNGDKVNLEGWKGKVVIVNLFHTQGNSEGALAAIQAMEGFHKMYQNNTMIHLVSISVDPQDNAKTLSKFANKVGATLPKWELLSGSSNEISMLVRESLLLDVLDNNSTAEERKFIYSNKIVLLDTKHRIRGFYDSTNQEALSKLDDEIKVQIAEELRNMRDGR